MGLSSRECVCGHGWFYHHDYDEFLERFADHGCEHWSGCGCKAWRDSASSLETLGRRAEEVPGAAIDMARENKA